MPEMKIPEGVTLERNKLKIDMSIYRIRQADDTLFLFRKKPKPKPDLGITCKCSNDNGVCSISLSGDGTARCQGDSCCGWVLIAGKELETLYTF